jgi:hypothetical protein
LIVVLVVGWILNLNFSTYMPTAGMILGLAGAAN